MLVFCYENKIVYNLIQALQLFFLAFFTKKKKFEYVQRNTQTLNQVFVVLHGDAVYIYINSAVPECEYYST